MRYLSKPIIAGLYLLALASQSFASVANVTGSFLPENITNSFLSEFSLYNENSVMNITGNGSIYSSHADLAAISSYSTKTTTININATTQGSRVTSLYNPAILIYGLENSGLITLQSGTITSHSQEVDYDGAIKNGTIAFQQTADSQISIGANGKVQNLSNNGSAIYGFLVNEVKLTVINSGEIVGANALYAVSNGAGLLKLTNNSSGIIKNSNSGNAFKILGAGAEIENSGTIEGDITIGESYFSSPDYGTRTNSTKTLKIINSGIIKGDITLGNESASAASSVTINDGEITGNIAMIAVEDYSETNELEAQFVNLNGGNYSGAINGAGVLNISGAAKNKLFAGSIGSTEALLQLNVADNSGIEFLNSKIQSIKTYSVSIAEESILNLKNISDFAELTLNADSINIGQNSTLSINGAANSNNYTISGVSTNSSGSPTQNSISLANQANLAIGSNSKVYSNINSIDADNNYGNVNIAGSAIVIDGSIGATNKISTLNIGSNLSNKTDVEIKGLVAAKNINVSNGASFTIASSQSATGSLSLSGNSIIKLQNNSSLVLQNNSSVFGNISAVEDGSGSIAIDRNSNALISGNIIGNPFKKISSLSLLPDSSLNLEASHLFSNSISLEERSTLRVSAGGHIHSNVINLGNNSTLHLQNVGYLPEAAAINGSSSGNGNLVIASGNYNFGAIGSTYSINNLEMHSGASSAFNGNIHANNINIFDGARADFAGNATIYTNSFNVNSGATIALTVSDSQETAPSLKIIGSAIIDIEAKLSLTITAPLKTDSVIKMISATNDSSLNEISGANINVNLSGNNIYNNLKLLTKVSGNEMFLITQELNQELNNDIKTINFSNNNQSKIYETINSLTNSSNEILTIQNYLRDSSNSDSEKEAVLNSLQPAVDNSANRISFNNIDTISNIINARLDSIYVKNFDSKPSFNNSFFLNTQQLFQSALQDNKIQPSSPFAFTLQDQSMTKKSIWVQTFGNFVKRGNNQQNEGYNATSSGLTIGIDHQPKNNLIIGLSSSYIESNIRSYDKNKRTLIDSYQLSFYSGYKKENYFFNNNIGFTYNQHNSSRAIDLLRKTARASYGSINYSIRSDFGSNIKYDNNLILTPIFSITAIRNHTNNYRENGAGDSNLIIKNKDSNFFETRFGIDIGKIYSSKNFKTIYPQISASFGYDFARNKQGLTAQFAGQNSSFTINGSSLAQENYRIGTGLLLQSSTNTTININYGIDLRKDYVSNAAWLRLNHLF